MTRCQNLRIFESIIARLLKKGKWNRISMITKESIVVTN
jgi:hypothetical protein